MVSFSHYVPRLTKKIEVYFETINSQQPKLENYGERVVINPRHLENHPSICSLSPSPPLLAFFFFFFFMVGSCKCLWLPITKLMCVKLCRDFKQMIHGAIYSISLQNPLLLSSYYSSLQFPSSPNLWKPSSNRSDNPPSSLISL